MCDAVLSSRGMLVEPVSELLRYMLRRKRGEAKISGVVRRQQTYVSRGCEEAVTTPVKEGSSRMRDGLCEGEERGRGRLSGHTLE